MSQHSFSIESKINPITNQPFGPKYSGNFHIKRPTFLDETMIECRIAAERNAFGLVDEAQLPPLHNQISRIFNTVAQISTEKLPAWFDRTTIFLDDGNDMKALTAVNQEVSGFFKSFRSGNNSGAGGEAS
jgi:predicted nucleotidyltransferase